MKIIKLIKLILLKLIIRLDEVLIEAKPKRDERNKANKAIFNANNSSQCPNNGRVKKAKVSSCTRCTGKALNGKVKRDDKTNVDRRANGNKRRGIDKATIGEIKKEIIKIKIQVEERINLRMLEGMR